jgi:hypothetical protein
MAIDHLGKDLEALGVSGRDLRCLLFLPQIYVGWVGPHRDIPFLEALLDTTARRARFDPECVGLARGWLFERPSHSQFQSGCALLRMLARSTPEPLIRSSDVLEAMLWAVRAAKATCSAEPTKDIDELRRSEAWRALNDLELWLEVDTSDLWLDILSDESERTAAPSSWRALPAPAERREAVSRSELQRPAPARDPSTSGDTDSDDEHSALLLIREPARLRAAPFPLARRIG